MWLQTWEKCMNLELLLWGFFYCCKCIFSLKNPITDPSSVWIGADALCAKVCPAFLVWCWFLCGARIRGHLSEGSVSGKAINTMEPSVFREWFHFIIAARATTCLWGVTKIVALKDTLQNQRDFWRTQRVLGEIKAYFSILDCFQRIFLSLLTDLGMFFLQEWFLMKKIRKWETWAIRSMLSICLSVIGWDTTGRCLIQEMQSMYWFLERTWYNFMCSRTCYSCYTWCSI